MMKRVDDAVRSAGSRPRARVSFSTRVLIGLAAGLAAGLVFGELVAPLQVAADAFVRLLQMTVLPYVTVSIIANLGGLSYGQVRVGGLRVALVLGAIWAVTLGVVCLLPLTFPPIESASFFSAGGATAHEISFLELYIPTNPFHALANGIVPAVVLFSVVLGLALAGIENKAPLLTVLHSVADAIGRMARFIVRLTPCGIFAIAAHAAGTLDFAKLQRLEVFLIAYVVLALFLALWVLPGLVAAVTPIGARETLAAGRDALLTAFLVGDLFIVLPSLMEASANLVARRIDPATSARELPSSIVPLSFTFPHAGKLLSLSFVLFAGWYSDAAVPLLQYPRLVLSGVFAFFGSMNVAVPFLLDLFRIPADTFDLFLATGVVNARVGSLLAAVHTLAVALLGSAAITGAIRFDSGRIVRYLAVTAVLLLVAIVTLRVGFAAFLDLRTDGRAVVAAMQPLASPPVDARTVARVADVPPAERPGPTSILAGIRARGQMRVGIIDGAIPYTFRNDRGQLVGLDVEMAFNLARELEVTPAFVAMSLEELGDAVRSRAVDIVMSGARLTPLRAEAYAFSEPYLEETLAFVVPDEARGRFATWDAIRALGPIHLGMRDLPYYIHRVQERLPAARLETVANPSDVIARGGPYEAFVVPAERGSIMTMFNPAFSVVVPEGGTIRMPLAYPLAGDDPSWNRFVNAWVALKRHDGFIDRLYEHWVRGRAAAAPTPRWSVVRDVLHLVP